MAIEAMKVAGMTYQGSASGAARPVKAKESVKPEPAANTGGSKAAADVLSDGTVKPLYPASGNTPDRDASEGRDNSSSGNGHQTSRQLQQAVEKLKKNMMPQTEPVFGYHEGTNRVTIKIVDKDSKDVVKEYPPEETLDMIQKIWEMAGILVDEKG